MGERKVGTGDQTTEGRRNGHDGNVEDHIRLRPDGFLELTRTTDSKNPDPIVIRSIGTEDQFSTTVRNKLPQNGETVTITRVRTELPNSSSQ